MKNNLIYYKKGYKYQLAESYYGYVDIYPDEDISTRFIKFNKDGFLTILQGYAWDGPSGPTFDTKDFMRGSLVHDVLYQLIRQEHIGMHWRVVADKELWRICREDGMPWWRAMYVYYAVLRFAKNSALPKNQRKVFTAP